jgi:hypothetical protein
MVNRFLRNAGIGAAFCSHRALFYREWGLLPVLAALGALAGCLYTLLEPAVRSHKRLHYLPWVLGAYLVIFGVAGVTGLLQHDPESLEIIKNPWFIGFVLLAAPFAAYAAARMFEDRER